MHSNWLCLQARNVLHKDAERACSVNFDMHTWLGNCWKKKEKASVLGNWTSNSILDPFSLFTSPFFHHPHRILLSPMSFRKSIWWKQTQHRRNILVQTIYSLHNTPKENICLPGTGRKKKSCGCTDLNMETSQWLSGYYCNEHLLTALFQLQRQACSLGCSEFMRTWMVPPCDYYRLRGSCLSFACELDPERSPPLCALTMHGWSEQASASATTWNELFLDTSQEPLMLNLISFAWSKQDSLSVGRWNLNDHLGKGKAAQAWANRDRWMQNETM